MAIARSEGGSRNPLRLWPGVLAGVGLLLVKVVMPLVAPGDAAFGVLGGLAGALAIAVWWVFFSRAPWSERVGAVLLMVAALAAMYRIVHPSIANGMMGRMLPVFGTPVLALALVAWAVASRGLSSRNRRWSMAATIVLTAGTFALMRTGGITGGGDSDLHWRWSETPEDRLLARSPDETPAVPPAPEAAKAPEAIRPAEAGEGAAASAPAAGKSSGKGPADPARDYATAPRAAPAGPETRTEWPGFRGPDRDDAVRGVRIETDWAASPPVELWRRPIGPGWSSFAVRGDRVYTQEQRGEDEVVASYSLATGKPVWMHRDAARFWESNGGAGPRATPTLSGDRLYTFGATGILNVLNAHDGAVVWSRNVAQDIAAKVPGWGFAGSPLVKGDVVIVAASGALVAYELKTGDRRWFVKSRGGGYSSPHPLTIDGTAQVLLMGGHGATSVLPEDGTQLWEHPWPGGPIVQPAVIAGGDLLISSADAMGGLGTRRIRVGHGPLGWSVEERWTSRGLKPYFNDFVVHKGHAFGFDGSILACIDLEDGQRKWKGGRFGNGQLLLLPDQDLLLVLSEEGELALVGATTDQFTELARFKAIEGKTWNHPALAGDVLLVRNGQEMVAFRLSLAGP